MRWLGLDIGRRNVGAAVCDDGERVSTPLAPLRFDGPAALAEAVAALVAERSVGGVVVGVPTTRHGAGRGEQRVAAVVEALRVRLTVPVETEDERGTSVEAEALLREAGVPPARRAALIDGVAARIILDAYLARRRQPPRR
ncbi:MAG: Holliday junction resolvase RuvX [Acidobacteriota bacterium]